ncbi:shikimate dehydrogenase [Neolewinella xylanilytica]|uniref:Shikimate dehydrogenase n=1 Tax=Neolewinella xylanilytica TaxID=1514080 RepID=A0A2S6I573_9BACT|nr:shikimate dehydrogenase [Neolewinella xylanilytica]PPK86292.1 shikimate dehydrogenase [Neolewinella xylanilytica]
MPTFALIGYPLTHSFSQRYFTDKFAAMGLSDTHRYLNFEVADVAEFAQRRAAHPDLLGCNVTIPHKQAILPLLDEVDSVARRIGAVNTIRISEGRTTGFNTDYLGFRDDLLAQLRAQGRSTELRGTSALVLGTGGAALAVREALLDLGMNSQWVSRRGGADRITYAAIDQTVLNRHQVIINTTPLGMHPDTQAAPPLPYHLLGSGHFCYDLIYNPAETRFLQLARQRGAGAANGLGMLHLQAEASWKIWNPE